MTETIFGLGLGAGAGAKIEFKFKFKLARTKEDLLLLDILARRVFIFPFLRLVLYGVGRAGRWMERKEGRLVSNESL